MALSLVADYGSDHESDEDVDVKPAAPKAARSLLGQLPPPKKASANAPSKLFGGMSLPPPSKNKDKVQVKLPVAAFSKDQKLSVDDDDTWQPPVKRAKADVPIRIQQQPEPQQSKSSLSSFLPAPKHSSLGSGAALGAGSGGSKLQLDHDDEEDNRPAALPSHATLSADQEPSASWQQQPEQAYSHHPQHGVHVEPSRDADTAYVSTSYPTDAYNYDYAQTSSYAASGYAPESYSYAASETAAQTHNDEVARVLREEQERERKRTRGRGQDIPIFTEVKQQDLTAGARPPEAMNMTGAAFGPQHPGMVSDKKGSGPSKLAKRKHQITALLHDSRARERELLERKAQGLKTKGETMAKYGW